MSYPSAFPIPPESDLAFNQTGRRRSRHRAIPQGGISNMPGFAIQKPEFQAPEKNRRHLLSRVNISLSTANEATIYVRLRALCDGCS